MLSYPRKLRWLRMNFCCFNQNMFSSSSNLAPLQLPSPMETHLWYVLPCEVKSESLLRQYLDLLAPSERGNVSSMRGDELRKNALLARALVRTTIARYQINSQVSPRSLKFRKNIHGKPEVLWQHTDGWHPSPLHFNLSHTSSLIACGVTMGSPIGIDVEEKQRKTKNQILSFARRFFSHHEVQMLTRISDPEVQRQEFVKLWTLKEAYVKALGRGFSGAPFNTFTIHFNSATRGGSHFPEITNAKFLQTSEEICVEPLDASANLTTNWQFTLLELAGSHYAAICREKNEYSEGKVGVPMKLIVRKTIPLVEDQYPVEAIDKESSEERSPVSMAKLLCVVMFCWFAYFSDTAKAQGGYSDGVSPPTPCTNCSLCQFPCHPQAPPPPPAGYQGYGIPPPPASVGGVNCPPAPVQCCQQAPPMPYYHYPNVNFSAFSALPSTVLSVMMLVLFIFCI